MGMIDGKELDPAEAPEVQPRVVVKVTDAARRERALKERPGERRAGEREDDVGRELVDAVAVLGDVIAEYQDRVAGEAYLEPMVGRDERERLGRGRRARFDGYAAITVRDEASAAELAKELDARDDVETAYVEGGPTPPPVNAGDDPRSGNQGYLDAAPDGIDARWAWGATDGTGIGFVDLEQGWTLNHEDLAAAGITIISGVSQAYAWHGTAVLGRSRSTTRRAALASRPRHPLGESTSGALRSARAFRAGILDRLDQHRDARLRPVVRRHP
ncbi:hypothetical protein [Agromyces sp. SYSU T0242]|uniref:hypothetical protein n=1 Tax=Agromyces litoreus TaxID=3158561 RepID=UPI003392899A